MSRASRDATRTAIEYVVLIVVFCCAGKIGELFEVLCNNRGGLVALGLLVCGWLGGLKGRILQMRLRSPWAPILLKIAVTTKLSC